MTIGTHPDVRPERTLGRMGGSAISRRAHAGRVLVIGGTGMLRPAVDELLDRGSTVLGVARRPGRGVGGDDRGSAAGARGDYFGVAGQWSEPAAFVDELESILGGDTAIEAAIAWVHTPYRQTVLEQLGRVLTTDATVLQIWGSASQDPREVMAEDPAAAVPTGRSWSMRHVYLGYQPGPGTARWLTEAEISSGVLDAWDSGREHTVVGRLDPWDRRP